MNSKKVCFDFQKGMCSNQESCRFLHELRVCDCSEPKACKLAHNVFVVAIPDHCDNHYVKGREAKTIRNLSKSVGARCHIEWDKREVYVFPGRAFVGEEKMRDEFNALFSSGMSGGVAGDSVTCVDCTVQDSCKIEVLKDGRISIEKKAKKQDVWEQAQGKGKKQPKSLETKAGKPGPARHLITHCVKTYLNESEWEKSRGKRWKLQFRFGKLKFQFKDGDVPKNVGDLRKKLVRVQPPKYTFDVGLPKESSVKLAGEMEVMSCFVISLREKGFDKYIKFILWNHLEENTGS